jgi:hypothetical protein
MRGRTLRIASGERHKRTRDARAPFRGFVDDGGKSFTLGVGGSQQDEAFCIQLNNRKDVIEVVGQEAGKPAHPLDQPRVALTFLRQAGGQSATVVEHGLLHPHKQQDIYGGIARGEIRDVQGGFRIAPSHAAQAQRSWSRIQGEKIASCMGMMAPVCTKQFSRVCSSNARLYSRASSSQLRRGIPVLPEKWFSTRSPVRTDGT